jgi:uncharacterized DUF497 family protein
VSEPWDPEKAEANLRKHGVGFPEAMTVERDPRLLMTEDRLHSLDEERWIVIGVSNRGRVLRVTCTYRNGRMRPITARRATKRERHEYFRGTR